MVIDIIVSSRKQDSLKLRPGSNKCFVYNEAFKVFKHSKIQPDNFLAIGKYHIIVVCLYTSVVYYMAKDIISSGIYQGRFDSKTRNVCETCLPPKLKCHYDLDLLSRNSKSKSSTSHEQPPYQVRRSLGYEFSSYCCLGFIIVHNTLCIM